MGRREILKCGQERNVRMWAGEKCKNVGRREILECGQERNVRMWAGEKF